MSFSEVEMKISNLQKEQVKCFRIIVGDSELLTGEPRVEAGLSLMCAAICGECLGCICKEIILLCLRRCCMKRDRRLENSIHNYVQLYDLKAGKKEPTYENRMCFFFALSYHRNLRYEF